MGILDWFLIGVVLISTLISIWRGAVREIFSLATWVLAAIVGMKYNHLLVPMYAKYIAAPEIQLAASFITLVVFVVVIGTIIGVSASKLVNTIGLKGLDKVLGMGFGCARGILIIAIVVYFARFTELPAEQWWTSSKLLPHFEVVADKMESWMTQQGIKPFQVDTSGTGI